LSYFNIKYDNRIDQPAELTSQVIPNENIYVGLINRSPTSEELAVVIGRTDPADFINATGIPFDPTTDDPLAVFPGLILFDNRRSNIASEEVDGIDVQASTMLETAAGDWSFDLSGTYYLDFDRNITAAAPAIDQLNRPGRPVDLKLRGHAGWAQSAWNVNAYVNYVDSYDDINAATPTAIDSWTTVDLTLRYDASKITESGVFSGVNVTLGVNNLFDEDPPVFLGQGFGLGYDPANADPIGRFVSLRLAKRW
jgi:outer membrane receptor protein involved in Fe transport